MAKSECLIFPSQTCSFANLPCRSKWHQFLKSKNSNHFLLFTSPHFLLANPIDFTNPPPKKFPLCSLLFSVSLIPTTILSHPDCYRSCLTSLPNSTLAPYKPSPQSSKNYLFLRHTIFYQISETVNIFLTQLIYKRKKHTIWTMTMLSHYISCKIHFYFGDVKIWKKIANGDWLILNLSTHLPPQVKMKPAKRANRNHT